MTLVVALKASDGVVIASDGQATNEGSLAPTRGKSSDKLFTLHDRIAFGCAGSAGMQQRVVEALQASITPEQCELPIEKLRPELLAIVNPLQHQALSEHVATIPNAHPAHVEILFAGMNGDGPWVYEINMVGHDEVHLHGEAIGHAKHFPHYLMASTLHYDVLSRGIDQVSVLAYRAVVDAIKADANALGPPVHVMVVKDGKAEPLAEERLKAVQDALNTWKDQEKDIFRRLPGEPEAPPTTDESTGIDAEVAVET